MKKLISAVLLVTIFAGCSPTWWANFKSNPLASVQTLEQEIAPYLSAATAIFNAAVLLLPADKVAPTETAFATAVSAVNTAEKALNDAVSAAAQAENANPDFTALMNAVLAAVDQVEAVIEQVKTLEGKEPAGYAGLQDSHSALLKFKR